MKKTILISSFFATMFFVAQFSKAIEIIPSIDTVPAGSGERLYSVSSDLPWHVLPLEPYTYWVSAEKIANNLMKVAHYLSELPEPMSTLIRISDGVDTATLHLTKKAAEPYVIPATSPYEYNDGYRADPFGGELELKFLSNVHWGYDRFASRYYPTQDWVDFLVVEDNTKIIFYYDENNSGIDRFFSLPLVYPKMDTVWITLYQRAKMPAIMRFVEENCSVEETAETSRKINVQVVNEGESELLFLSVKTFLTKNFNDLSDGFQIGSESERNIAPHDSADISFDVDFSSFPPGSYYLAVLLYVYDETENDLVYNGERWIPETVTIEEENPPDDPEDPVSVETSKKVYKQFGGFERFYPNPVSTEGTLEYSLSVKDVQIVIYNLHGQKINSFCASGKKGKVSINFAGYPSGIYFIQVNKRYIKIRKNN